MTFARLHRTDVLFLEGEPGEIKNLKRDARIIADDLAGTGAWLKTAMASSWEVLRQLGRNPLMAGVLGERHRIVANDLQNAALCSLIAMLLDRAIDILDDLDLSPASVRSDLAGPRSMPQYLYSSAE